tara:strand:- start:1652 stop:2437 length:786 start_codon:yes stop_codon:yes gene_type:complete
MRILIVGKNSFLVKNHLIKIPGSTYRLISHKEIDKYDLNQFNYIINFSIDPRFYYEKYNKAYDTNFKIINKINLKSNITKFIMMSSGAVYGNCKGRPFTERSKTNPNSTYGKNKMISERYLQKKLNKYMILRIPNIIEQNIKKNKINFFDELKKNFQKKELIFNFNINSKRDFITAEYFWGNINKLIINDFTGIVNLSSGIGISIKEICNVLTKLKKDLKIKINNNNIKDYVLSSKKLNKINKIKILKKDILRRLRNNIHD